MLTYDDVASTVSQLPEACEGVRHGHRAWSVNGKVFAWERPFSKADVKRFGDQTPPEGPILAVTVADLADKEAVLAANPKSFFTIEHFKNYPAILIQLSKVTAKDLRDALVDAWLVCAPAELAEEFSRSY